MLFFSYFKELVGKEVTVELKNDLAITGTLHSVDHYLNIKLENTRVVNETKYPHMVRSLLLLFLEWCICSGQLSSFIFFLVFKRLLRFVGECCRGSESRNIRRTCDSSLSSITRD